MALMHVPMPIHQDIGQVSQLHYTYGRELKASAVPKDCRLPKEDVVGQRL